MFQININSAGEEVTEQVRSMSENYCPSVLLRPTRCGGVCGGWNDIKLWGVGTFQFNRIIEYRLNCTNLMVSSILEIPFPSTALDSQIDLMVGIGERNPFSGPIIFHNNNIRSAAVASPHVAKVVTVKQQRTIATRLWIINYCICGTWVGHRRLPQNQDAQGKFTFRLTSSNKHHKDCNMTI